MQKLFSGSNLLMGLIEEIDVHQIREPKYLFYGTTRSETSELVNSIRQNGLLHPIIVRIKEHHFEIVAGCRRFNACKKLGIRKIICHIVELDDKSALEVSLTENIQRKSLDAIEEARAFKAYVNDFGWGGLTDLASKISKSNTYVCRRLALLELPTELLEKVRKHEISPSTAEELIPLKNSQEQNRIADLIVAKSSSSREARKLVESSQNLSTRMDQIPDLDDTLYPQSDILDIEFNVQRSFDKSITAIKIAMSKIASILESVEENWIVYEILMQHKNMLNAQIDLLIREKKKLSR